MFTIILYMNRIDYSYHTHDSENISKDLTQFIHISKSQLPAEKFIDTICTMRHNDYGKKGHKRNKKHVTLLDFTLEQWDK